MSLPANGYSRPVILVLQRGIKQREAGVFIPRSRITTHKMLREVIDAEGMRIFVVT